MTGSTESASLRWPYGERRHPEGCLNTRDLGGLRLLSGGRTAFGRVFRTAAGQQPIPDAARALARAGHARVHFVDLRSPHELGRPNDEAAAGDPGPEVVVHPYSLHDPELSQVPRHRRSPAVFARHYEALLHPAARVVAAVAELAAEGRGPVVIGCRLGKDRTGVVTLLLLHLAEVRAADIAADFALTARAFRHCPEQVAKLAAAHGEPAAELLRRCELPASVARRVLSGLSPLPGARTALCERLGVDRSVAATARVSLKEGSE